MKLKYNIISIVILISIATVFLVSCANEQINTNMQLNTSDDTAENIMEIAQENTKQDITTKNAIKKNKSTINFVIADGCGSVDRGCNENYNNHLLEFNDSYNKYRNITLNYVIDVRESKKNWQNCSYSKTYIDWDSGLEMKYPKCINFSKSPDFIVYMTFDGKEKATLIELNLSQRFQTEGFSMEIHECKAVNYYPSAENSWCNLTINT